MFIPLSVDGQASRPGVCGREEGSAHRRSLAMSPSADRQAGRAAYRKVGCHGTRSRSEEGRLSDVGVVEPEGTSRPAKPGCSRNLPTQPRADAEAGRRCL